MITTNITNPKKDIEKRQMNNKYYILGAFAIL